jgi:arylsulfatase A-like enzyme
MEPVLTPNIDRFAEESVYCTDAISACPLCSPARASLMTGRYPLHTNVFTNCKIGTHVRLGDKENCISDVLRRNGYQTGYIGKWHLDEPEQNRTSLPESGATYWDAYTPPGPKRHGFDFWHVYNACDRHRSPHYWENSHIAIQVDRWSPIHETDVALEFIEKTDRTRPFALFLSWNPPHSPYDSAPEEYKRLYQNLDYVSPNSSIQDVKHHTYEKHQQDELSVRKLYRDYFAAVSGLDAQFGRILQYLRNNGLFDDTLIVLTADHGDMLTSHGLIGKHVWYEESIGIPFMIGGCGLPHRICRTVFGSQDIPVTLLSLLGQPVPETMDGSDISQKLLQGDDGHGSRTFIAACPGRELFLKAFQASGKNPMEFGWRGIRTDRYTYVVEAGYEVDAHMHYYLYDNSTDPYQMHPAEGSSAIGQAMASGLHDTLVAWLREQHDGFIRHID